MIELETEWLRATVLPEVGCKVQSLISKATGRQILWQNPRVKPRPCPIGSNFDNYWSGGWDDAFPTCDTCTHAGETYPNLGALPLDFIWGTHPALAVNTQTLSGPRRCCRVGRSAALGEPKMRSPQKACCSPFRSRSGLFAAARRTGGEMRWKGQWN